MGSNKIGGRKIMSKSSGLFSYCIEKLVASDVQKRFIEGSKVMTHFNG
jgi:hypothetical protein